MLRGLFIKTIDTTHDPDLIFLYSLRLRVRRGELRENKMRKSYQSSHPTPPTAGVMVSFASKRNIKERSAALE
jgi:hypothetical protein